MIDVVHATLNEAADALAALRSNNASLESIVEGARLMIDSLKSGGCIYSCGNGGSMCDAMHFAEELTGRYRKNRPAIRAISISDSSHISCVGNDYGYDSIFSRYLEAHGKPGDVLLAISTSGSSKNVLKAVETAASRGMKIVSLTGKLQSAIGLAADVDVCCPAGRYADRVQELHIKVIHTFMELIEREFFSELYKD